MIRTNITGIGDPFILKHGDTYYMYATSAPDGFRYFTSDNLIDWKEGDIVTKTVCGEKIIFGRPRYMNGTGNSI